MKSQKRILITGITGFVGSHLAEYCLKKKHARVFGSIFSHHPGDELKRIEHIKNKVTLLEGDLTNRNAVARILSQSKPGEPYNIGSGKTYQIKEVLDILLSFSGVSIKVKPDPALLRPSDVPILYCDASKFRKATGWKPEIKFEKTLLDTLNYWRKEYGTTQV